MAEWTDPLIRTLIDERRTRNDEFHDLGRNRERFWGSIASKINQENGTSFSGHQCKEKFSNLVRDYNTMCDFMNGKSKARSRTGARYFDEFRTHFWERSEDEFDRVRSINTFNRKRSRGSGNITPIPSTRDVERELRSSERRLSRSSTINRSQSPPISRRQSPSVSRRQSPSVSRRQSLSVGQRRSELPPVNLLTNDDYMDLTMDNPLASTRHSVLFIPNNEVFTEWQGWLQHSKTYESDSILEMLLQGNLIEFERELPKMILDILSYHDVPDNLAESNYHLFMVGLFSQAQFRGYKLMSNKESGLGRFDLKIEPTENAIYQTSVIMEFKLLKHKNDDEDEYNIIDDETDDEETDHKKTDNEKFIEDDETEHGLRKKSEEALAQIVEKKYRTGIRTTKLVECGITFQGKRAYVLSRVLRKEGDQWVEDS